MDAGLQCVVFDAVPWFLAPNELQVLPMTLAAETAAVLISGGIDSAVLTADLLGQFQRVVPLYIGCGLRWEETELAAARSFLDAVRVPGLDPLVVLEEPIGAVYGSHWSTTGEGVPGPETPDEAVYLPGRNVLLTVKASVFCRLREIGTLALGSLGSNPFPDSTPEFFQDLESVLRRAMAGSPRLVRPYSNLHKPEVILRGRDLPLNLTFSCIQPRRGLHCGSCNKCMERRKGFADAGVADQTRYANASQAGLDARGRFSEPIGR